MERWQPGYWRWNGHEHIWAEGHYVARPRPHAEWIAGRWEQRPRGWVYVEGHWN
ncbi:MAG: YXWGXW repeat-containing protein [Enhydrobacter sp.]|nr:YXWGXW repeat-containing protein [Enhydrobacter sp.]